MPNFAAIGQTLLRHGHFSILQDGGRPPSWICDERIWTIQEGDLVVFITVQKLVEIDEVVLIICIFFDFTSLAGERLSLIHAPKIGLLGGFDPFVHGPNTHNKSKMADGCHLGKIE